MSKDNVKQDKLDLDLVFFIREQIEGSHYGDVIFQNKYSEIIKKLEEYRKKKAAEKENK